MKSLKFANAPGHIGAQQPGMTGAVKEELIVRPRELGVRFDGGEVVFDSGIYAGIWGSTIDISNGPNIQRDTEVTYYLGYSHDTGSAWTFGASVITERSS